MTKEKLFSLRLNEFGFSPITFLGSDKDVFPYRFHVVKWVDTEPFEAYSLNENKTVTRTSYCFAIGELEWNEKEPCWEFRSIGTLYLAFATEELNNWILRFCGKYEIKDGAIVEHKEDD